MEAHSSAQRKITRQKTTLVSKILSLTAFGHSIIPYIWLIGIIVFAERARQYLGYWPKPSQPDPKNLPLSFEQYHAILWDGFVCLKWTLVTMPLCYFANRFLSKTQLTRKPLKIYLLGWILIVAMIAIPRIDFVMWFMD